MDPYLTGGTVIDVQCAPYPTEQLKTQLAGLWLRGWMGMQTGLAGAKPASLGLGSMNEAGSQYRSLIMG